MPYHPVLLLRMRVHGGRLLKPKKQLRRLTIAAPGHLRYRLAHQFIVLSIRLPIITRVHPLLLARRRQKHTMRTLSGLQRLRLTAGLASILLWVNGPGTRRP